MGYVGRTVSICVALDLQTAVQMQSRYGCDLTSHQILHAQLHWSTSYDHKTESSRNIRMAVILLFEILQKYCLNKGYVILYGIIPVCGF